MSFVHLDFSSDVPECYALMLIAAKANNMVIDRHACSDMQMFTHILQLFALSFMSVILVNSIKDLNKTNCSYYINEVNMSDLSK